MTTKDLDDAIDRAVRDMMSAEPRPGFRGRVFDRLDSDPDHQTRESRSWAASGTWRLPALAGALVLALIAFVVMQRRESPTQPSPSAIVATRPAPSVTTQPPARESPSTPARVGPRVAAADVRRVAAGLVQAASVDDEPVASPVEGDGLEPLNEIAPLGVAPIADTPIQTRDISIGELSVPPIVVDPLPLPGGAPVYPREDR
jgi:hypothetical protein